MRGSNNNLFWFKWMAIFLCCFTLPVTFHMSFMALPATASKSDAKTEAIATNESSWTANTAQNEPIVNPTGTTATTTTTTTETTYPTASPTAAPSAAKVTDSPSTTQALVQEEEETLVENEEEKTIDLDSSNQDDEFNFVTINQNAPECTPLTPDDIDFTLVTQTSFNRLWLLEQHCRRWQHKISIVVGQPGLTLDAVEQLIQTNMPYCHERDIKIVICNDFSEENDFPVNRMRNMAMNSISTTHAVYVDMDFVTSPNLYQELRDARHVLVDAQTAVVLPAFRFKSVCPLHLLDGNQTCIEENIQLLPDTKRKVQQLYVPPPQETPTPRGHVEFFDRSENPHGHLTTDYAAWFAQNVTVEPIPCMSSTRYEPYLVSRVCRDVPPYPKAFTGYGKNKLAWVQQLHWQGWKFVRINQGFVTHVPHSRTKAAESFVEAIVAHKPNRANDIYEAFQTWLKTNVPNQWNVPFCSEERVKAMLNGQ